jgi:hypothetical protein
MRIYTFILVLFSLQAFAQTTTDIGIWVDHLPFRGAIAMHQEDDEVYCVTEQGVFIFEADERAIRRLSKVNGLSDIGLSAAAWSDKYGVYVLGYENGNIDILSGESVKNYPDLKQTANYPGLKRVNHITTEGDLAYISTDFGIITFDLLQRFVRETFIIGPGGTSLKVLQTALGPDTIYAATDEGLLFADRNDFLIDFDNWSIDSSRGQSVNMVTVFDNRIFINDQNLPNSDSVLYREGGQWKHFDAIPLSANRSLIGDRDFLNVCNGFSAQAFDAQGQLTYNVTSAAVGIDDFNPLVCQVSQSTSQVFWVLSDRNGLFLNFEQLFNEQFEPNSPRTENALRLHHDGTRLFVAPGTINEVWGPLFNNDGYFILDDFVWENKQLTDLADYRDVVSIIADPENTNHYFVASYGNGFLEFLDGSFVKLYNDSTTNDEMLPFSDPGSHRVGGFSYDIDGNLWFANPLTDRPLCRLNTEGVVECFGLGSVAGSATSLKDILYTTENQVWLQTRTNGIVVANLVDGQVAGVKRLTPTEGSGNLPSTRVLSFAEDLDGEIWIGTDEGVAVIYSPINVFEPNANYDASTPQIPQEDNPGFGDPLLGNEAINDIEIDGANKKWFATANSGVFYTSDDGTEQIYNFTTENSPLLSNNVIDIEVDPTTGMVFFATDRGIVSFQGVATEGGNTNSDVFAYPNPVEPGYNGPILIRGLVTNAQVKITDIEGNLVFETIAEGGQALWGGKNFSGARVASGVYLAYITDDLGQVTAITKILVVN